MFEPPRAIYSLQRSAVFLAAPFSAVPFAFNAQRRSLTSPTRTSKNFDVTQNIEKSHIPRANCDPSLSRDLQELTYAQFLSSASLEKACKHILANFVLSQALELLPTLVDGPSEFGLRDLTAALTRIEHENIALHILKLQKVDWEAIIWDVKFAHMLEQLPPTVETVDAVFYLQKKVHFPQLLSNESISLWLRTRALVHVSRDPRTLEKLLSRHGQHFLDEAMPTLVTTVMDRPGCYHVLTSYVLNKWRIGDSVSHALCLLVEHAPSKKEFHQIWKPLHRKAMMVPRVVWEILLLCAERLHLSYDMANICAYGYPFISSKKLAKGLLSIAWRQRGASESDNNFTLADDVNSLQIVRVLNSMDVTTSANVLADLAKIICNRPLPGRILWAILFGAEQSAVLPLSHACTRQLTNTLLKRPYLEQLRYMSLEKVDAAAIEYLLRGHINRIARLRENTDPMKLQESADVKFIVAGMVMMSEKIEATAQLSVKSQRPLISIVRKVFESWDLKTATEVVQQAQVHVVSPTVAMTTIGILVYQKNFTLAIQLLQQLELKVVPRNVFNNLLICVCRDYPKIACQLTTWLIASGVYIPVRVLRQMIVELGRTPLLTGTQSIRRIEVILSILRGQNVGPGVHAASALVDSILKRAQNENRGSRLRLQWALGIAQTEGVPDAQVQRWLAVVQEMRSRRRGYWSIR